LNQRIFTPTFGASDWRRLLADPSRQWRQGRSAFELAIAWEAASHTARGLPPTVVAVLDTVPEFEGSQLLLGVPEHQVALDGGGHASQTDLWALLRSPGVLTSVAVEGQAGEGFDKPVTEWLRGAPTGSGKPDRLKQLCRVLGITEAQAHACRYQLLHRTAAAILEAQRFGIDQALLLVQSFVPDPESLADFRCFAEQLGASGSENAVVPAGVHEGVKLWLAWVTSPPATHQVVRAALA
jgi:hypothetical protein